MAYSMVVNGRLPSAGRNAVEPMEVVVVREQSELRWHILWSLMVGCRTPAGMLWSAWMCLSSGNKVSRDGIVYGRQWQAADPRLESHE